MTIEKNRNGAELTVKLIGWLDTTTSPELSKFLDGELDGVSVLTFDFKELEYVSSAGLRVLLSTQKAMSKIGTMTIAHANSDIKDMFDFTGFLDVFTLTD